MHLKCWYFSKSLWVRSVESGVWKHCLHRQLRFRNRANVCERTHVVFMQKIQSVEKLYLVSLKYNISQAERNEPLKYSLKHKTEEFSRGVSLPEREKERPRETQAKRGKTLCALKRDSVGLMPGFQLLKEWTQQRCMHRSRSWLTVSIKHNSGWPFSQQSQFLKHFSHSFH